MTAEPDSRTRCTNKIGWYETVFVLPEETIGKIDNEEVVFQSPHLHSKAYSQSGTLTDWQKNISSLSVDNSRLSFSISVGFAAPLLHLIGEESAGFHFKGRSSSGKTSILKGGLSIYGGPEGLHTWRATSNGLESIAVLHNDSLLCLDELGQLHPKEASEVSYLLANGTGKARSNRSGYARDKLNWRFFFLSSGEVDLSDHIRRSGNTVRAGQEVRIINIPVDTGKFGAFEYLHSHKSGADFAWTLSQHTQKYHGVAGKLYLEYLVTNRDLVKKRINELMQQFIEENTPACADGQVHRVLRKFSIVAAAGRLATEIGITGWPEEEALWGASQCFAAWLSQRGGVAAHEVKAALEKVRSVIELHGDSRFSPWESTSSETSYVQKTSNRLGFKKVIDGETHYFVFQEAFKYEICNGLNPEEVVRILIEKGWLIPDSQGKSTRAESLPGFDKNIRCYRLLGDKIFGDDV